MATVIYHKHHIIPKHLGGTDNPDNLKRITVEEHAQAHKELYEKYGRWQDRIAWQGLAGIIDHKETVRQKCSEAGKKSNRIQDERGRKKRPYKPSNRDQMGSKNPHAKTYKITLPDGKEVITECLSEFCRENVLNLKAAHKSFQRGMRTQGGYRIEKV